MNFEVNDKGCVKFTDTSDINFDMWSLILKRLNWLGYGMPDEDSVKEYFDKGTFLQKDQSDEVLKIFGQMHETPAYDDTQIIRDNNIAKNYFGLTDNIKCAGYLLIDGDMLNFSYDGYIRSEDHRAIAYPLGISTEESACAGLIQFVNYGNIRLMGRGFEICKPPTQAQRTRLASLIRNEEDLYVDISNYEGHVVKHFCYHYTTPGTVFRDIDEYFESIKIK